MKSEHPADYLGSKGLQDITGIKASTWRYWDCTGKGPVGFPASFKIGKHRVWRRAAVLEWLAAQEVTTT